MIRRCAVVRLFGRLRPRRVRNCVQRRQPDVPPVQPWLSPSRVAFKDCFIADRRPGPFFSGVPHIPLPSPRFELHGRLLRRFCWSPAASLHGRRLRLARFWLVCQKIGAWRAGARLTGSPTAAAMGPVFRTCGFAVTSREFDASNVSRGCFGMRLPAAVTDARGAGQDQIRCRGSG